MNLFLKLLVAFLIFFTPFSFAATEPWAFSILQGIVVLVWLLLVSTQRRLIFPSLCKSVFYVFAVLVGLSLMQSCFPQTLIEPIPLYPITLVRLYTLEHASMFVTYFALVLLIIQLFPSFSEVKQLLWIMLISAISVALCAWCFPQGEYVAKLTGVTKYAAMGPFVNRNHAGMFFVMHSLLALGLFFTQLLRRKWILTREQKNKFIVQQIGLLGIVIGLMVSGIFTRSRGAMLSLLVGLFGYAFLYVYSIPSKLRKKMKGFFYTIVLLLLSIGWVYTHMDDINAFSHRATGISSQTRQMMYHSAWRALQQYPIWGIGIGSLPVVLPSYTAWNVPNYIERLHNDWLEMALGMGWAGSILLLVGLLGFIWGVLKRLKRLETRKQFVFVALLSALLAMGAGSLVDFHFFIPGCALVFFLLLGLVLTPTFHKHHVHSLPVPPVGRVLWIIVLLSAGWIPLQKTRCWRQFHLGSGFKTSTKLAAYEQGLSYYPSPRYAARLANAYYQAGKHSKDVIEQLYYFETSQQIAQEYLEKYPKDKGLSILYIKAHRRLN